MNVCYQSPGSLLAFHFILGNTEDIAFDNYSPLSMLCHCIQELWAQNPFFFLELNTPFPTPKLAEASDLPGMLQNHLSKKCRSRGLIHQRARINWMPLSQPLLDMHHGFWETIRCGGNIGNLVIIPTCKQRCSNTCVSVPEGQHTFRVPRTSLWEKDAFNMTYAQKSSFNSTSDLIYKNPHWCVSQGARHMANHVGHYNGGSSSTEKSVKYSKNDIDFKKWGFFLLSGTSNLHHLGRRHRPLDVTWHPAPYNQSSITQYCLLERGINLSGSYFCSKSLIKVQKEVGGSMAATLQYRKVADSPLNFCHVKNFRHLLYKP